MTKTFNSFLGEGRSNSKITNQIFSNETISDNIATGCIFVETIFNKFTIERVAFTGMYI